MQVLNILANQKNNLTHHSIRTSNGCPVRLMDIASQGIVFYKPTASQASLNSAVNIGSAQFGIYRQQMQNKHT